MLRVFYAWVFSWGLATLAACTPIAPIQSNSQELTDTSSLFPYTDGDTNRLRSGLTQPAKSTFALELGPKLVELQATYSEQHGTDGTASATATDKGKAQSGRYFDLLASSSRFDGKLVGESEFTYSGLPGAALTSQLPTMSRLTVRGTWGAANYGASYRNFGSGFIATNGIKFDNDRDLRETWAEYDFKLFRFKSTLGESWERISNSGQFTLTRSAATSLNLNRGSWNAQLLSSYSIVDQDQIGADKSTALSHGLSIAYKPASFLTIEPGFMLKEEWSRFSGGKTETPSGGLALVTKPSRDLSLTGRASYARGFSDDPLKDSALVNAGASLDWKLGKTLLGEQALSLQFQYNRQSGAGLIAAQPANFNGLIQWKLVGF